MSQDLHLNLFTDVELLGSHLIYYTVPRNYIIGTLLGIIRREFAASYDNLGIQPNAMQINILPGPPQPVSDQNLEERIKSRRDELQPLASTDPLSSLLHSDLPNVIHGVLLYPYFPVEWQDKDKWCGLSHNLSEAELNQKRTVAKALAELREAPSTYAKSGASYRRAMETNLIYNHRAGHSAPSIAIYNKVLSTLVDALESGQSESEDLPSDLCKTAWNLCATSAEVYGSKSERMQETKPHMDGLLAGFEREILDDLSDGSAVPDVVIRLGRCVPWIEEWKLEVGLDGDAEIQLAIDYLKMVAQPQYEKIRQRTCCPCILLAFSGPFLQIYGAVFTEIVVIQPIGEPIRLYGAPPHEARIVKVASTFDVLRTALLDLGTYYSTTMGHAGSDTTTVPTRLFPSPTAVDEMAATQLNALNLVFTGYLYYNGRPSSDYSRALYTGTIQQQRSVVIKFCHRYSSEAHVVLAERGLAPKLHLRIDVRGGLKMIVMDRLGPARWKNLATAYKHEPSVPSETRDAVRSALQHLHNTDLVFGDVRRPNVFVDTVDSKKIMLVDFEFAGRDVRYPLGLNTSTIRWVMGVEPGGKILKEYDMGMCDKL